jgi:hypothetical protein
LEYVGFFHNSVRLVDWGLIGKKSFFN